MDNVVIYARYSSDKQTEQSIEGQLRVCHEYAERYGLNIINEYIDRAISGTSDKRPAFLQMIEDASKKEFNHILVYKLDRFSRNKYDSVIYKHKLNENGVKVISATESISDSPEGKLVEGLLEMMAEMYSQDLSQKVKRGIRESLLKGNFIGGHILYGYKVVDKKVVVNEDEAKIIRHYFEEYANGKSKKIIVAEMNQKGLRQRNGKPFTISSFHNCLNNEKYTGKYKVNDMVIENGYPQIIDQVLFNRVQEMLAKNKKQPGKGKAFDDFLLTGKAFCGYCGANIVGVSGTSRNKTTHYYYACTNRYKKHTCKKKYNHKEKLETDIVEFIYYNVLNPELQDLIIDKIVEELKNSSSDLKINEVENQIKNVDKQLDNCFEIILNATTSEIRARAEQKSQELEILKNDLIKELSKLRLTSKTLKTKQDIKSIFNLYIKGDINSYDYRKKLINNFVNAIYIFDGSLLIYFDLFDKKQILYNDSCADIENINDCGFIIEKSKKDPNVRILRRTGSQICNFLVALYKKFTFLKYRNLPIPIFFLFYKIFMGKNMGTNMGKIRIKFLPIYC